MSTFKKCKIVMLSTNEPSKIGNLATYQGHSLAKVIKEGVNPIGSTVQFWNLYIISDDEIKENNTHFYNPHSGQLHISGNHTDYIAINKNGCKKIIATSDTSLEIFDKELSDMHSVKVNILLPQPSQQFIQKFVEEYNKGTIITDVLVEYELVSNEEYFLNTINPDDDVPYFDENLKINPKDNTITIKKVKDNWNRKEVETIVKSIFRDIYTNKDWESKAYSWIEENL